MTTVMFTINKHFYKMVIGNVFETNVCCLQGRDPSIEVDQISITSDVINFYVGSMDIQRTTESLHTPVPSMHTIRRRIYRSPRASIRFAKIENVGLVRPKMAPVVGSFDFQDFLAHTHTLWLRICVCAATCRIASTTHFTTGAISRARRPPRRIK